MDRVSMQTVPPGKLAGPQRSRVRHTAYIARLNGMHSRACRCSVLVYAHVSICRAISFSRRTTRIPFSARGKVHISDSTSHRDGKSRDTMRCS